MDKESILSEEFMSFNLTTSKTIGESISKILNRMKCVNCHQMPKEKVSLNGNCSHRYCEICIEKFRGQKCIRCQRASKLKEAYVDPFTTELLASIRRLDKYLQECDKVNIKTKSGEPKSQDFIEGYEEFRRETMGEPSTSSPAPHLSSLSQIGMKRKNLKIDDSSLAIKKIKTPEKPLKSLIKPKDAKDLAPNSKRKENPIENELPNLTQHSSGIISPVPKILKKNSNDDVYDVTNDKPDPPNLSPYQPIKSRRTKILSKPFSTISPSNDLTSTLDEVVLRSTRSKRPIAKPIHKVEKTSTPRAKPPVLAAQAKKEVNIETPIKTPSTSSRRRDLKTRVRVNSGSSAGNSSILSSTASPSVDITKKNQKGETQLHIACRTGAVQNVEELIDCGADVNAKDHAGWRPLHDAICGKGKALAISTIVTLLCDAGANVNVLGLHDATPLNDAARLGMSAVCSTLLSFGASRSLRNGNGLTPRDSAATEEIRNLIVEFKGPYKNKIKISEETITSMSKFQKAVYFFTYEEKDIENFKRVFDANVSRELNVSVSHVIYSTAKNGKVDMDFNYIYAICNGCLILTGKWLHDSLEKGELLDPKPYEITGCLGGKEQKSSISPLQRSQMNREKRNPGLFSGLNILLFKRTFYVSSSLKIGKNELGQLIECGGGQVTNREPNPDAVEPLLDEFRPHIQNPNNTKLAITSHFVLFNETNEPNKKINMEHIKYLHVDWLIDSIMNFTLCEPDPFVRS